MPKAGETFLMQHTQVAFSCIILHSKPSILYRLGGRPRPKQIVTVPAEVVGLEVPTKEFLVLMGLAQTGGPSVCFNPSPAPSTGQAQALLPITHLPLSAAPCCLQTSLPPSHLGGELNQRPSPSGLVLLGPLDSPYLTL